MHHNIYDLKTNKLKMYFSFWAENEDVLNNAKKKKPLTTFVTKSYIIMFIFRTIKPISSVTKYNFKKPQKKPCLFGSLSLCLVWR